METREDASQDLQTPKTSTNPTVSSQWQAPLADEVLFSKVDNCRFVCCVGLIVPQIEDAILPGSYWWALTKRLFIDLISTLLVVFSICLITAMTSEWPPFGFSTSVCLSLLAISLALIGLSCSLFIWQMAALRCRVRQTFNIDGTMKDDYNIVAHHPISAIRQMAKQTHVDGLSLCSRPQHIAVLPPYSTE